MSATANNTPLGRYRELRGWEQTHIARRLRRTRGYVSIVETNPSRPKYREKREALAKAYRLSLADFDALRRRRLKPEDAVQRATDVAHATESCASRD